MSWFSPSPADQPTIDALRRTNRHGLSPTAKDRIRHTLLTTPVTEMAPKRLKQYTRDSHSFIMNPMIASIIASIILVLGIGTSLVANAAKPGDALFGLDRALERTQLRLTLTKDARVRLLTKMAAERERESEQLGRNLGGSIDDRLQREDSTGDAINATLDDSAKLQKELDASSTDSSDATAREQLQQATKQLQVTRQRSDDRRSEIEREGNDDKSGSPELDDNSDDRRTNTNSVSTGNVNAAVIRVSDDNEGEE